MAAFREHGFVRLPGLLGAHELTALREAIEAAPERDPGDNPLTLGPMRFASNLFYGSEAIQAFLGSAPVAELVEALVGPDSWVRWDQAVWKGPGGPEFPLHQDNGYTGLAAEHLQLWVALTPMTTAEGGLLVVPGAHRGALPHEWQGNHVRTEAPAPLVPLDAQAGDVIAFSSFLPHATAPNVTDRVRLAYVAEFLPWSVPDPSVALPHLRIRSAPHRQVGFEDRHEPQVR